MAKEPKMQKCGTSAGITCLVRVMKKTVFPAELSVEEMKQALLNGEYEDILDEEELEIVKVEKVEIYD